MGFFRSVSPTGAFSDLRTFIGSRKKHEIWLVLPALLITGGILWAFYLDSRATPEWKRPEIIWVRDWRLDRSKDEIEAQQLIDMKIRAAAEAELEKRRKARRDEFKKIDDGLRGMGL